MTTEVPSRARRGIRSRQRQEIDERLATCSAEAYEAYHRIRRGIYALVGAGSWGAARAEAEIALGLVECIQAAPDPIARLEFLRQLQPIEERAARGYALQKNPRKDRAALKAFRACPRCSCCDHVVPEDVTPPG